jgi:hypothetical protein
MNRDELTKWALANGWREISGALSLTKPTGAQEAIVRMIFKTGVVHLEIKKPSGKWDKVAGESYAKIEYDEDAELPRGMGLDKITGLTKLMRDNKDRQAFAKLDAKPKPAGG